MKGTRSPADKPSEEANFAEFTYTYTLQGGEISAQGVSAIPRLPAPPPLDAITSGTRKYDGAKGEVSVRTVEKTGR